MSKELTPLQALKKIKQARYFVDFELDAKVGEDYKEELDLIESALKEHEAMNQTKLIVVDDKVSEEDLKTIKNQRMFTTILQPCEIKPLFDEETKKKLKALEIVKKKKVDIGGIKHSINVAINNKATLINAKTKVIIEPYAYYNALRPKNEWLTQQEYDLLKEVLLCQH